MLSMTSSFPPRQHQRPAKWSYANHSEREEPQEPPVVANIAPPTSRDPAATIDDVIVPYPTMQTPNARKPSLR